MTIAPDALRSEIASQSTTPAKAPWKMGDPSSFQDLFSGNFTSTAASTPSATEPAAAAPTAADAPAASVVPLSSPTFEQGATVVGPDGGVTSLNSMWMASQVTADQMAAKLGGTVTEENFAGGYSTSAPMRDISFTNSNVKISAGMAATLFAEYGDAPGSQAWQAINSDLGRDPMSTAAVD